MRGLIAGRSRRRLRPPRARSPRPTMRERRSRTRAPRQAGSWPPFLTSAWAGWPLGGSGLLDLGLCMAAQPAAATGRARQARKPLSPAPPQAPSGHCHQSPRCRARTPLVRNLNLLFAESKARSRRRSAMALSAKLSCHRKGEGLKIPSLTAVSVFRRRSPRRANGPGAVSSPPRPHARTKGPPGADATVRFYMNEAQLPASLR